MLLVACFSLGGSFFAWRRGFRSAGAVFPRQRGFLSADPFSFGGSVVARRSRFSLGVVVFARQCCFLLGLGLLFSMDFGSWLLPVTARSGLCSLSFHFASPFSFTYLKILLTTGLGYCLPYIIPSKVFFLASRFSFGAGFRSAAWFSLGGAVFARRRGFLAGAVFSRRPGFLSAAPFFLGGSVVARRSLVFAQRCNFRSAWRFSLGGAVFS